MTTEERSELVAGIFSHLQIVKFAVEGIVSQPHKTELNQSRASATQKTIRRIEEDFRKLLGVRNQEDINAAIVQSRNDHLGAREQG